MSYRCPVCGNTEVKYSAHSRDIVCSQCGHTADPQREQEQLEKQVKYGRTMHLAEEHLKAGDFADAARLASPLRDEHPTDTSILLLLLSAYTSGFEDLVMADERKRKDAAEAYDRLSHLHCNDQAVNDYVERRKDYCRAQKHKRLGCYIGAVMAAVAGFQDGGALMIFLGIVGGLILLGKGSCYSNAGYSGGDNPFR